MGVRVIRTTHNLPKIRAGMEGKAAEAIKATCFEIEADWKQHVRVDTGAYKNSIQTVTYSPLSAAVVSGVEHSVYNEFGTHKMSAAPAAGPAAERARGGYLNRLRGLVE